MLHGILPRRADERAGQPAGNVSIHGQHDLGLRLVALDDGRRRLEVVQRAVDRRRTDAARQRIESQPLDEGGEVGSSGAGSDWRDRRLRLRPCPAIAACMGGTSVTKAATTSAAACDSATPATSSCPAPRSSYAPRVVGTRGRGTRITDNRRVPARRRRAHGKPRRTPRVRRVGRDHEHASGRRANAFAIDSQLERALEHVHSLLMRMVMCRKCRAGARGPPTTGTCAPCERRAPARRERSRER